MPDEVLSVRQLDVFYGQSQALFGLSLSVHRGETLALLGRNGAGKSTTMKAVAGVLAPRRGEIRLRGVLVNAQPPHRIARAGIGFVPEDRQIFADLSVEDNLQIAVKPGHDGARAWTLERIYQMLSFWPLCVTGWAACSPAESSSCSRSAGR